MTIERQIHLYPSSPRRSIKNILCLTDHSDESQHAMRYAVALASAYGARLYVCYCVDKAVPDGDHELTDTLKDLLESFATPPGSPPLDWEGIVVKGKIAEMVSREAARLQVDLILLNSSRRSYSSSLLGPNIDAICRTAPCPVLVTHSLEQDWIDDSTGSINLKKLLVAYDYSDQADWAFSYALSFAEEYEAELHLLNVVPILPEYPYEKETLLQRAKDRIKHVVPKEAYSYCGKIKQVVREGPPHREILTYARENNIDLICIGAHGAGFDEWTLFGSNADRVLRQAGCPVLIAHPFKWYSAEAENREASKILIAYDGTSYGEAALRAAAGRTWPQGSKLRVITVMEPTSGADSSKHKLESERRASLEKLAESAAHSLRSDGRVVSHVVREGKIADEIIAEAKEWGSDIIFIGTHGRPADYRIVSRAISETVSADAPCKVEVVQNPLTSPAVPESKRSAKS